MTAPKQKHPLAETVYLVSLILVAVGVQSYFWIGYVYSINIGIETLAKVFGGYLVFLLVMWVVKALARIRLYRVLSQVALIPVYLSASLAAFLLFIYLIYLLGGTFQ